MFVIKRNQVIITALVIMIAVAGYLNFVDTPSRNKNQQAEASAFSTMSEESDFENALVPNTELEALAILPESSESELAIIDVADGIYEDIDIALSTEEPFMEPDEGIALTYEEALANEAAITDESVTVSADANASDSASPSDDPGAAVFVNAQIDSTYFVQAKLDREQARSKQKEILMEVINNEKIESDTRSLSANAMLEIQNRIEKETAAEAMIESKGFKEAYVRINDDSVDVVVSKDALTEAEIARIEEIVTRKTGATVDQIHISPLRKK